MSDKIVDNISRMRHIPSGKKTYRYGGSNSTDRTIAQILRDAGYTDKQIKELKAENRIVLTMSTLGSKVKGKQELYVLEGPIPTYESPSVTIDRFGDLELE